MKEKLTDKGWNIVDVIDFKPSKKEVARLQNSNKITKKAAELYILARQEKAKNIYINGKRYTL